MIEKLVGIAGLALDFEQVMQPGERVLLTGIGATRLETTANTAITSEVCSAAISR